MIFIRRATAKPRRLAALPGAFNPPPRAHLALAHAALASADEALFVLPRAFPHKPYTDAPFEDRVNMLTAAVGNEPRFSIASRSEFSSCAERSFGRFPRSILSAMSVLHARGRPTP